MISLVQTMLVETAGSFDGVDPAVLTKLQADGFSLEPLYHGSSAVLDRLDHRFSRTADYVYTAPDPDTAGAYGDHLYLCVGRQEPQADLIDDDALRLKLAETFAPDYYDAVEPDEELQALKAEIVGQNADDPDYDEMDAEDDPAFKRLRHDLAVRWVADMIEGGDTYGIKGRFQDALMQECFGTGFNSVRFADPSPHGGGRSESIVFPTGEDVVILKRLR